MSEKKRNANWFFDAKRFGAELERRRKTAGLSREALSEKISKQTFNYRSSEDNETQEGFFVSPSAIRKWECGISIPTIDNVVAILSTLNDANWRDDLLETVMCGVSIPCLRSSYIASVNAFINEAGELILKQAQKVNEAHAKLERCDKNDSPLELLRLVSSYRFEVERYNASVETANREINGFLDGLQNVPISIPQFTKYEFPSSVATLEQKTKHEYMRAHPEEFSPPMSANDWDVF